MSVPGSGVCGGLPFVGAVRVRLRGDDRPGRFPSGSAPGTDAGFGDYSPAGMSIWKQEPSPATESTPTEPPSCSAIDLQIDSPSPVP